MIYGISTHVVARESLKEKHLDQIAAAGFDTVELFANRHQVDFDDPTALRAIAKGIARNHLYVNSVHAPFYASLEDIQHGRHLDIGSKDDTERRRSVAEISASFVIGTLFHVDYYVLHTPDHGGTDSLMRSMEELLTLARELPFKLCFENIPGRHTSVSRIARLIEKHQLPIGIAFDTGHSHLADSVSDDIREHGVQFYTTHIHDNDGSRDAHMMPFSAGIDWVSAMNAFREVDYKWGFILEVRRPPETPLAEFLKTCRATTDRFREMETVEP